MVDWKFPEMNEDNMLDFGPVRVGDEKVKEFSAKNNGLYKVILQFVMKNKNTKKCFTIIDTERVELEPTQEKPISIKFRSQ